MENVQCNVIYVDRSVSRDRSVKAGERSSDVDALQGESAHMLENVKLLLDVFDEGMSHADLSSSNRVTLACARRIC